MKQILTTLYHWFGIGTPPGLTVGHLESLARKAVGQTGSLDDAASQVYDKLRQEGLLPRWSRPWPVWVGRVLLGLLIIAPVIAGAIVVGQTLGLDGSDTPPTRTPTATNATMVTEIQYQGNQSETVMVGESLPLRFKLVGDNGQPVVGKQVDIGVTPNDLGWLVVQTATTSDSSGQVEATFTAGPNPGTAQIVATVRELPSLQSNITLQITGKPQLQVRPDDQNSSREVIQGEVFLVQFLIDNVGSAQANQVRLHSKLPANVAFIPEYSERCRLVGEEIICEVGNVGTLATANKGGFYLRTDASQTVTLNPNDYWLTYTGSEEKIEGTVPLVVNVRTLQPTAIWLSATETRLLASNAITTTSTTAATEMQTPTVAMTTTITIELVGDDGEAVPVNAQVNLSLTKSDGTPADNSLGRLETTAVNTVEGRATVTFVAGVNPGTVDITAATSNGLSSNPLRIQIVKQGKLTTQDHFYNASDLSQNSIIVFQLPVDTPIELLGETTNGAEKVALTIWLPRQYVTENGAISGLETGTEQIYVGEGIDDPLNQGSGQRQLQSSANGILVEIIDQNVDGSFVRIRITGWVNQNSIEGNG